MTGLHRQSLRDRTYWAIIAFVRGVFRLWAIPFDLRGQDNLPTTGPGVVAANHIGYLDFTFIGLAAANRGRMIRYLAKGSVFRMPVVGPLMGAMGHIPVDRGSGSSAYRHADDVLARGELVGFFPEGTISRAWMLKPFKRGAAALAHRQQVLLIPVITWGGHRVLTVDGHFSLRRRIPVTVIVGVPIAPDPGRSVDDLNSLLRDRMAAMLDQAQRDYPDRPRRLRDRWWLPAQLGGSAPDSAAAAVIDAAKIRG